MDADFVARTFDLGSRARLSETPLARGKEGEVWRLDTADGAWAVKRPFGPADEDAVRRSASFQEDARAAGVPTPLVRRTVDGHVFATIDDRQVRVYEWVDLLGPDPDIDPVLVGEAVAALHRVPTPHGGPAEEWYAAPLGAARWDGLVARLRSAGAPFAHRLADLRDELVALEGWIEAPRMLRLCHRDLWADNLRLTTDGRVCIIDWENSGPADPSQELGCLVFEFARSDPSRARALVEAYRAAGGPAPLDRRGDLSMLVAQLGHITEAGATDWLEPSPRSPERADAEAWVAEVLDEPHTRALLDRLLAAVTSARPDS